MSGWLRSVNHLLEQLDDQAEHVSTATRHHHREEEEETDGEGFGPSQGEGGRLLATSLAQRFLGTSSLRRSGNPSYRDQELDDDDGDDDEYEEDEEADEIFDEDDEQGRGDQYYVGYDEDEEDEILDSDGYEENVALAEEEEVQFMAPDEETEPSFLASPDAAGHLFSAPLAEETVRDVVASAAALEPAASSFSSTPRQGRPSNEQQAALPPEGLGGIEAKNPVGTLELSAHDLPDTRPPRPATVEATSSTTVTEADAATTPPTLVEKTAVARGPPFTPVAPPPGRPAPPSASSVRSSLSTSARSAPATKVSTTQSTGSSPLPPPQQPQPQQVVLKRELKKLQQDHAALLLQYGSLKQQLEAATAEIQAQQRELQQAAENIQQERRDLDEERDELLADQEEELKVLQQEHQELLAQQKKEYMQQIQELKSRLLQEQQLRATEGGDWTSELEKALDRERDALRRLNEVQNQKELLQEQYQQGQQSNQVLQERMDELSSTLQEVTRRERQAEEKLDAALMSHKKQLTLRQAREAELERTIAELGAALSNARQSKTTVSMSVSKSTSSSSVGEQTAELSYREQFEVVAEELESARAELRLTQQRCGTLQRELQDLTAERAMEVQASRDRERSNDEKVSQLTAHVTRLEATIRDLSADRDDDMPHSAAEEARLRQLMKEHEHAKRQVASLSDQLVRHQGLYEVAKSEVLALKGRLEAATRRAENAEQAGADSRLLQAEGGSSSYSASKSRRRYKGTRTRIQLPNRSMRAALGLRLVEPNSILDQLAKTIDAIDIWMFETGGIMQNEPFARLALLFYFSIVHLWCFGLVFFHAVESEHGDLGELTSHRGPLSPSKGSS